MVQRVRDARGKQHLVPDALLPVDDRLAFVSRLPFRCPRIASVLARPVPQPLAIERPRVAPLLTVQQDQAKVPLRVLRRHIQQANVDGLAGVFLRTIQVPDVHQAHAQISQSGNMFRLN